MCVLCWLGSVPSSSCPRRHWKMPSQNRWQPLPGHHFHGFVQANKWWLAANPPRWVFLSRRLRQLFADRFVRFGYAMTAGWHRARWLARSGWYREKEKSKNGQSTEFLFFVRWAVTTYSQLTVSQCHRFLSSHPSMCLVMNRHLSHPLSAGILFTSTLCRPLLISSSLPIRLFVYRAIEPVPRWHHGSTMKDCFPSTSILILLAPLPMPMPAPAQVLTGWHCANLPPPSLSFVAHPYVALPPESTLPSLSLPFIPFIHFLQHFPCVQNVAFV